MNLSSRLSVQRRVADNVCCFAVAQWVLRPPRMPPILLILITLCWTLKFSLFAELQILSAPFQKLCLQRVPSSQYSKFYSALVCGTHLDPSELGRFFQASGLIHIIVVSGSHLLTLGLVLRFLPRKLLILQITLLIIYTLCTGADAPVVRALLGLLIAGWNDWRKLNFHGTDRAAITGIIILSFFPEWVASYSLLLSWTAALALGIISDFLSHRRSERSRLEAHIQSALLIYVIMFFPLTLLGNPPLISVIFNVVLGPLLGGVLFPACLICFFIPSFTGFVDVVWSGLSEFARLTLPSLPLQTRTSLFSLHAFWFYLISLHIVCELMHLRHRKKAR